MKVTATITVKPASGEKPARGKLEEAARLLEQCGFDILRIGRRGVSVEGEPSCFSRVLGVDAQPNKALAATARPDRPELCELLDQVEVAIDPQLY